MNIFHRFAVRSLKANRSRTLITVIGIVLSAAMFTAVTTIVVSVRGYGIAYEEAVLGDWHVKVQGVNSEELSGLRADGRVERVYELQTTGYAYLDGLENLFKPYLCLQEMSADFAAHMPVCLTEGRLPENEYEVLIPGHVRDGGVEIENGARLELAAGYRRGEDGEALWQNTPLCHEEKTGENLGEDLIVKEHLEEQEVRTYTVVGFYDRPEFEDYTSPGYTVLSLTSGEVRSDYYDAYVVMKHPKDATGFREEIAKEGRFQSSCNNMLLRFYGYSSQSGFLLLLYGMGGILIFIIILGSVALIYNAFAISVSEPTKQFGLLSSIGATRKQMKQTVCHEAFVLCLAGIPAGVLAGLAGIGITLSALAGTFEYLIGSGPEVKMKMIVSLPALALAAGICMTTVLFSAYLPMRRALKLSAIDALRQKDDIRLTKGRLRIPGWVYRRFGLEGMVAFRTFQRNRKRYRATILSLAMSILLFVSVGSYSEYLFGSFRLAAKMRDYDIEVSLYADTYDKITELSEMTQSAGGTEYLHGIIYNYVMLALPPEMLTEEAAAFYEERDGVAYVSAVVCFPEDADFEKIAAECGASRDSFRDPDHPEALLFNNILEWMDGEETEIAVCQSSPQTVSCISGREDEEERKTELAIGAVVENEVSGDAQPAGGSFHFPGGRNMIRLLYPASVTETVMELFRENNHTAVGYRLEQRFRAQDHAQAAGRMRELLRDEENSYSIYDVAAEEKNRRDIYIMVNVFCFGFIALISLIAAANIFNTISTGMNLRRREFAMLKSLGMTQKEFVRMLNLECLIYGTRGLVLGFLSAVPCTAAMYYFSHNASMKGFYLAWSYFVIAAGCVFLVVYLSMWYGQKRAQSNNLIGVLRGDGEEEPRG